MYFFYFSKVPLLPSKICEKNSKKGPCKLCLCQTHKQYFEFAYNFNYKSEKI